MDDVKIIEGEAQDPKDEQIPDEETRKTLEAMQAEGHDVPALEEPVKKEEPIKEEPEKPKEGDEDDSEEEVKPNRLPKMMPVFKQKIAEKAWSKRETELLGEIETLKNKPTEAPVQQAKVTEDMDSKIAELAEKKGVDAELIKDIIGLVPNQDSSEEVKEAMQVIKDLKASNEQTKADVDFSKEFEGVKPLIKAEYPNISDGDLSNIQKQLKDNAFTEEYAKTPLSVIYKGVDGFREAVITKKKTAESSRSGQNRNSEVQDYSSWTEDDVKNSSREDFEKYSKWVDENKTS